MDLNEEKIEKKTHHWKIELNKLALCRHSLKQVTGTELSRLATCPILGTGRSEGHCANSHREPGRKQEAQAAPPATAPCFFQPHSHGDSFGWPWALGRSYLTSSGENQEGPAGSHACCPAQALCQEHQCWVPRWIPWAWASVLTQAHSRATARHLPRVHGVKVTTWQRLAKHLSWTSFRNGAKVQVDGKGGINRGPYFPIPVLALDSLTGTNTHSSSYHMDMQENCLLCWYWNILFFPYLNTYSPSL